MHINRGDLLSYCTTVFIACNFDLPTQNTKVYNIKVSLLSDM